SAGATTSCGASPPGPAPPGAPRTSRPPPTPARTTASRRAIPPALLQRGPEATTLGGEPLVLLPQPEDHRDAGEVDPGVEQLGDGPQPPQVVDAVAPRPARGAVRLEQTLRLVEAQGGRGQAHQLGRDRDAVDTSVRVVRPG